MAAPPAALPAMAPPQADPNVPIPPPPANPPNVNDVLRAEDYVESIRNSAAIIPHPILAPAVRADARRYEWEILSHFAGGVPPPPALATLRLRFNQLERRMDRWMTVVENKGRGNGSREAFGEVRNRAGILTYPSPSQLCAAEFGSRHQ